MADDAVNTSKDTTGALNFEYEPFKIFKIVQAHVQIRLLRILPGEDDSTIECKLRDRKAGEARHSRLHMSFIHVG